MPNFFDKYPYTDFHELNLDWILKIVKDLAAEWAETLTEWHNTQEEWQHLYDYVHDYFDNLDVQEEVNNKIDEMINDGTLMSLLTPVITPLVTSTVSTETTAWLADHITQPTTPAIDTSLTVSGAAADAEVTGSYIRDTIYGIDGNDEIELSRYLDGYYITTSGATVDINTKVAAATYKCAVIDCTAGDIFRIVGSGGGGPRLWCFIDSSGNSLDAAIASAAGDIVIQAPASSAKLVLNTFDKTGYCYKYTGSHKRVPLRYTTRFIGGSGYADAAGRMGATFDIQPNRKYRVESRNGNSINYIYLSRDPLAADVTPPYAYTGRMNYSNTSRLTFIAPQDNTVTTVWVPSMFNSVDNDIAVYDMGASDTISIAANDSEAFTDLYDYVCDGSDDQIEFQAATDGLTNGGVIQMSPGNFYFDSFNGAANHCVYVDFNNGIARTITYRGLIQNKAYNTRLGSTIHITPAAVSSRAAGVNSVFIGTGNKPSVLPGDDSYTFTYVNNVNFENFYLYTDEAFEDFIGINCTRFGCSSIKQVCVATEDFFYNRFNHIKQTTPGNNSIGISSCNSSNDEMALCSYEDCDVGGMYIAYLFNGIDHLVMRNCFAARNVYGFYFNTNYKTQTMINCADEGNYNGPYFKGSGHLTMIDMCVEPSLYFPDDPNGLPQQHAVEEYPGNWKGSISYTGQGYKPYFESGSGINFDTRCLEDNLATFGAAPSNPDYLQRYFDKNNNIWKTWNGSAWV